MKLTISILAILTFCINAYSQVPNYVPTNGLVGWWPFNGNANDESGHGNNGTVIGATLITDRNGQQAYKFDGINDIININSKVGNFGANDFSVSLWVYDEDAQNSGTLVGKRNDDANMLNLVWSNSPGLELGSPYVLITPKGSMLNEWKNCVLIRKGTNISIYINGVLEQKNVSSMTPNINNSANLSFGARYYYSQTGQHFKGSIDDIGIWNRALTEGEIKGLYSFEDYLASTKKEKEPELITNSSNSNHTAGENNQFNIPKNSDELNAKLDMIYDTIQKIAYLNELISNLKNNSDQSTEYEIRLNQAAYFHKLNYIIPNKYADPSISQAEWISLNDFLNNLGDDAYKNGTDKNMRGYFLYWSIAVRQKLGKSYFDIKWFKMVVNEFTKDDFPMGKGFYNECKNIVDGANNSSDSKNTKITNSKPIETSEVVSSKTTDWNGSYGNNNPPTTKLTVNGKNITVKFKNVSDGVTTIKASYNGGSKYVTSDDSYFLIYFEDWKDHKSALVQYYDELGNKLWREYLSTTWFK